MANPRLAQTLSTGYNPDGTPGTVSTGLPGPAGPPPTDEQVAAAVSQYLTIHPPQAAPATAELTGFGLGAVGGSGSYVALGSNGTVSGYVLARGSMTNVDLRLAGQGTGTVQVDSAIQANKGLTVSGAWYLSDLQVALSPASSEDGVAVFNPSTNAYAKVYASAFTVSSDRRLKDRVIPLNGSLAEVRTTPAYSYVMNGEQRRGLIADEAPHALLRVDDEGTQMLDLYDMVGTLWNAVRELAEKVGDGHAPGSG